jgi:ABC-type amino acid transport substrate-binding protein
MTITKPREEVLVFSEPYYYTPAQMAATVDSGITTLDGLAGKTVCAATATTYDQWLKGNLDTVSLGPIASPPADVKVKNYKTDQECAQALDAGRREFEGFLTSLTVVDQTIKNGTPIVKAGDPVYIEQIAASADKKGPDPKTLIDKVSQIIKDMHADGRLTQFSEKWFGMDLTIPPG